MSHPDPNGPPDLRPIQVGEIYENPVTRERATILELPWASTARRRGYRATYPQISRTVLAPRPPHERLTS